MVYNFKNNYTLKSFIKLKTLYYKCFNVIYNNIIYIPLEEKYEKHENINNYCIPISSSFSIKI